MENEYLSFTSFLYCVSNLFYYRISTIVNYIMLSLITYNVIIITYTFFLYLNWRELKTLTKQDANCFDFQRNIFKNILQISALNEKITSICERYIVRYKCINFTFLRVDEQSIITFFKNTCHDCKTLIVTKLIIPSIFVVCIKIILISSSTRWKDLIENHNLIFRFQSI